MCQPAHLSSPSVLCRKTCSLVASLPSVSQALRLCSEVDDDQIFFFPPSSEGQSRENSCRNGTHKSFFILHTSKQALRGVERLALHRDSVSLRAELWISRLLRTCAHLFSTVAGYRIDVSEVAGEE